MEIIKILVTFVGVMMSSANFPQVYRIYKNKSAKDISLITYSVITVGSIIWALYGFLLHDWVIIISYVIGVVGAGSVLALKLIYK